MLKASHKKNVVTDKNQKHERNLENSAKKTYPINSTHRWTTNQLILQRDFLVLALNMGGTVEICLQSLRRVVKCSTNSPLIFEQFPNFEDNE